MKLPEYKGSMFRGAFGSAFKNVVCIMDQKICENCVLQSNCFYFQIFETEIPNNNLWFLKNVKKTPHPFIIHPPEDDTRFYKNGQIFNVGLTFFDEVVNGLPYFILAFKKMGEKGISYKRSRFSIENVTKIISEKNHKLIYQKDETKINEFRSFLNLDEFFENNPRNFSEVKIDFVTPLRIQNQGQILINPTDLNPKILFESIIRRYLILAHLFGKQDVSNYQWNLDKNITIDTSNLYFYNWERYSNRQKVKISLSGFKGYIILRGELDDLIPLLKLGSLINIGKNTVFGLGKYNLYFNE